MAVEPSEPAGDATRVVRRPWRPPLVRVDRVGRAFVAHGGA